jgi:hypothetical protein
MPAPRLWVNEDRTVLVNLWMDDTVTVALRDDSDHTWGPPIEMVEELVATDGGG